jgi:FKBP-type peptidyl-prolyl cis-trans isomerase FkpA
MFAGRRFKNIFFKCNFSFLDNSRFCSNSIYSIFVEKNPMKNVLSAVLFLVLFISCSKENVDYVSKNEQEIKDYISKNNLTAKRSDTGLYYVINELGDGTQPTAASNVTVAYKGYFTNGTVFDQNAVGATFGLNQVIKGWTEGIPYFKTGGNGMLLVPSHLGYGNSGRGPIPGGAVIIFDVKLLSVN